jgi:hypothetical protein
MVVGESVAITISSQTTGVTNRVLKDTSVAATVVSNVTGAPGSIYLVYADNAANAFDVYLKFYDTTATVTLGTTAPDYVFLIDASARRQFIMTGGTAFTSGISYACVKTDGGTEGTTPPGAPITVWMVTS